jgi:hypothetical protein
MPNTQKGQLKIIGDMGLISSEHSTPPRKQASRTYLIYHSSSSFIITPFIETYGRCLLVFSKLE